MECPDPLPAAIPAETGQPESDTPYRQAPHFNLRSEEAIVGAITVMACMHRESVAQPPQPPFHHCQRGRKKPAAKSADWDDSA